MQLDRSIAASGGSGAHGPSGTATFLFTDIEDSSTLWERFPGYMERHEALHDTLVRAAIAAHHGYVFATGADGFGAAFAQASDAIAAACVAQRSLASEPWPMTAAVLGVRMGLHTGAIDERDGNYFGAAVNRAYVGSRGRSRRPGTGSIHDGRTLGRHRLDLGRPR